MTRLRASGAALVAAGLLLAACTTPYGERGLAGGYHDEKLDDTHYRVTFDGNGNTQKDQVWNFWIYRCAEITRQHGYHYFTISKDYVPSLAPQTPADPLPGASAPAAPAAWHARTRAPRSAVWVQGRDPDARQLAHSVYYYYVTVTTWHTNAVVTMLNAPMSPSTGSVLDAQVVMDQLKAYVHGDSRQPLSREAVMRAGLRWIDDDGRPEDFLVLTPPPAASAPARAGKDHA